MRIAPFILVTFLFACSDRPGREPFPGPQGRTTSMQAAETSQEVLGGFDPDSKFAKVQDSSQNALRGVATLKPGLVAPKGALVFLSARPLSGGPPLAVSRFRFVKSPFRFSLTEANKMLEDTVFEGMVQLSIRIDQDGDPLSRTPGDLFGQSTVKVGAQNLEILIDQAIKN